MRIWDFKARTIASPRSAIMANVSGLTSTKRPEEIDIEDRRLDPPELLAGRLLDPTRIDQQLYTGFDGGHPVAAPWGLNDSDLPSDLSGLAVRSGAANALGINDIQGSISRMKLDILLHKLGLR